MPQCRLLAMQSHMAAQSAMRHVWKENNIEEGESLPLHVSNIDLTPVLYKNIVAPTMKISTCASRKSAPLGILSHFIHSIFGGHFLVLGALLEVTSEEDAI